jgi:hypothetical protein
MNSDAVKARFPDARLDDDADVVAGNSNLVAFRTVESHSAVITFHFSSKLLEGVTIQFGAREALSNEAADAIEAAFIRRWSTHVDCDPPAVAAVATQYCRSIRDGAAMVIQEIKPQAQPPDASVIVAFFDATSPP